MYDVYGLGNALVDTEYRIDDGFLEQHAIAKGHMTLVEEDRLETLMAALSSLTPERMSGGSAANSVIAAQGFGAATYYSCKVADDATGKVFLSDLSDAGVHTNANAAAASGKSGRCLILVTRDAERSMNTFLGVSTQLSTSEIDEAALATARYFYVEGYLSSSPESLAAAAACRQLAEDQGVATAVSLSDPSMVELFRANLETILGNGVDHLFCNEEEALTWARTDRLDVAIAELKDIAKTCNVTLGSRGCLSVIDGQQRAVPGYSVTALDTNGAGDIYAGACLYGWCRDMDPQQAASFGNYAAAELVQQYGARLKTMQGYQDVLKAFRAL